MAYVLGTSANGKTIEAVMQQGKCLYRIQFTSGGALPMDLAGDFTSVGECQKKVDAYLSKKAAQKKIPSKAKSGA
jgi:hypothetical protein